MKHERDIPKALFHLEAWAEAVCHPLLYGDFYVLNDEFIPLQHQLLDMDRWRTDRQTDRAPHKWEDNKCKIPLHHLAHTSVCGYLFISHLLNKTL